MFQLVFWTGEFTSDFWHKLNSLLEKHKIHYKRHLRKNLTKSEKVSVKSGAMLVTINVEFHVKYELPEFLNQALDNFFMFLFSISSMLESKGCQRKQKVVDKIIY